MDVAEAGFWLKKIVSNLVLLPAGPMLLVVIGLALRRHRRLGRFLTGLGAVILFVFTLPVVADALARHDEHAYPPLDPSRALPADAAIVVLSGGSQLGASDYGGETVNATTLARLRAAARLAARTRLPILVTGGRLPSARGTEGDAMADVLRRDFNRPVRWIEGASLDTADNVRLSVPLLKDGGVHTAILVTDVSHMRRASLAFEGTGIAVIPAPTDYYANAPVNVLSFLPNTGALRRANTTLHEWLGAWWMRLRR